MERSYFLLGKNTVSFQYRNKPNEMDNTGIDVLPGNHEPEHVPVDLAFCAPQLPVRLQAQSLYPN